MNYTPNQNEKVQEEILADSNSDAVKTIFFKFFKNLSPLFCAFVRYNREY